MTRTIAVVAGILVCSAAAADTTTPTTRRHRTGTHRHGVTTTLLPSTTLPKDPRDPTGTMIPDKPAVPGAVPDSRRVPDLPKQPGMPPDPTDPGRE
jgi:hypothetical protein